MLLSRRSSLRAFVAASIFVVSALLWITSQYAVSPPIGTLLDAESSSNKAINVLEEKIKQLESVMQVLNHTLDEQRGQLRRDRLATQARRNQPVEHTTPASSLPSCAELMSRPGSKYKLGDFITRHTVPHKWTPRKDGSREFDLTSICSLMRYSADEARQCLANEHLNFIGDSLSRYQFHSLVHFIDKGTYPPRFPSPLVYGDECQYHVDEVNQSQCSPKGQPNICMELDWYEHHKDRSWNMLYQAVGGDLFGGRMECACARNDKERLETENLLYASQPDENGHRITLSVMQERGWTNMILPIRGYHFTGCSFNESCQLTDAVQDAWFDRLRNSSFDYNQTFPEAIDFEHGALRHVLPPVSIAIYNRGLWGPLAPDRAKQIFPAMFNWTGGSAGRCFYKSTTASGRYTEDNLREHETQRSIRNEAVHAGCAFLDYGHVTSDFASLFYNYPTPPGGGGLERTDVYWDSVHFQPWVYEELNNIFLNVLCNARRVLPHHS